MSDSQITNGQRAAHALDGINARAQSSSRPPEQFITAHESPIPRALFAALVFLERQAIMADPAVPEWVPDFPP
ncbi:MAG: hypothetical protein ACRDOA_23550, partial [Streptosporangiaceae bacterium]